jgi:type IV pilus assembly protein PilA
LLVGCAVIMGGVVVVGILAAIAIPNFVDMQYRAKRAEVPSNVKGIKTAQIAYDAAFDTYIQVSSYKPSSSVGKAQRTWVSGTDFDTLGWMPDGKVRGAYKVTSSSRSDFLVTGICDVDGDGVRASFTATKSINTTMTTGNNIY